MKRTTLNVLVKKNPLAIRWFHWINFPLLATMVWSGLLIFWASSDDKIRVFGHEVFPDWFYHPAIPTWFPQTPNWSKSWLPFDLYHGHRVFYRLDASLATGMAYHFFFMWLFVGNGLLYVLFLLISGEWRTLAPRLKGLKNALLVALHDLHLAKEPPQVGKYNDAQRFAYTGVIFLGAVMIVSGFAIYKPTQAYWLTALLGGYQMARWIHFWTTMLIAAFFLVHVAQVVRAGWNNFRSMVTGFALEPTESDAPPSQPEAPEAQLEQSA